jgi:parallel beta-helix repeat protein
LNWVRTIEVGEDKLKTARLKVLIAVLCLGFAVVTVSASGPGQAAGQEPVGSNVPLASPTPVPLDLADRCPTPGACTLYVATTGSNSNAGTQAKPFLTISKAASVAVAGSVICVGPGTYNEQVTSSTNGTAGHWITFLSTTPQGAHVAQPTATPGSPGNTVREFLIHGNYTEVNGFEVSGGDEGIYADGTFKCAMNNLVHNTGGDGIAMNCSDYSAIYGNTIHDCGKFATYCGSGISLYEAIASDTQAGFHNWVSHNISYDNNNIGVTGCHDGNGIIFDDWNNTQNGCAKNQPAYTPDGVVEENLAYGNGGVGIKPYQSSNIVFRNNTAFENQAGGANGPSVPAEIANEGNTAEANIFSNNIAVASQVVHSTADAIYDANEGGIWDNNLTLCYNTSGDPLTGEFCAGGVVPSVDNNVLGEDPLFVAAASDNFHLQADSPALGAGTETWGVPATDMDGNPLPNPPFIGAYAAAGSVTPTATATATATATPTATATGSNVATPTATATATATRTATQTPTVTPTPGTLSVSPSSLDFGDKTAIGKPSKAKDVTIKNNGNKKTGAAVSVTMESATPPVFTVKSQCDKTLAPGKKCKVAVIFTPLDDTTAETGSLKIVDSATGSPQSVGLSGMGAAPKKKK